MPLGSPLPLAKSEILSPKSHHVPVTKLQIIAIPKSGKLQLPDISALSEVFVSNAALAPSVSRQLKLAKLRKLGSRHRLAACQESWTHDAFDRLIVAQARYARSPLITADGEIKQHYPLAIW